MSADDELKNRDFAEFLEAGEKVLYAGHGQTGSTIGLSLSILSPILSPFLGGRGKDALKQWRVAITDRRVLLVRGDAQADRTGRFERLTNVDRRG